MDTMNSYMTKTLRPRRRALLLPAVVLAASVALVGCDPGELLTVETPDIIDPTDVQSAAGATAVRIGALARFVQATTGTESLLLLGGLMTDEWVNGDTFIARHELDRRDVTDDNTFLTTASRNLHRARQSAEQAVGLMDRWLPNAPRWQVGEMHFAQAYLVNLAGEHYCDGLVFSSIGPGEGETFGSPITTTAAFERALGHANDGLAVVTGTTVNDQRVRNALRVTRGRILMNLDRPAEAAAAVADVPTSFAYQNLHSPTTYNNAFWSWNISARRYSVSDGEGLNGLNFATADDPRLPVCEAPCPSVGVTQATRDDASRPLHVQTKWERESPVTLIDGIAARMIEAEAQYRAGEFGAMMATLNAARATVDGLAPLDDPGTDAARLQLLFRERAFWHFGIGQRFGDLRRLVRQYGLQANDVWPTGEWHKAGGTYADDVNIPVPFAEANNPNVSATQLCMNRNP
jgi:starch-binding outer membrane protein, SusD/RagB family